MSDSTIGNPLSWSVDHAAAAGKHLGAAAAHIGHGDAGEVELPRIRHMAVRDLRDVLRAGFEDFLACRTDVIFLCLLYPVIGALLAWVALHNNLLPLLFPITSGFALLGPVAAVGLYEMSRRREQGEDPDWSHAISFTRSPSFAAIFALGLMLGALFIVWVLTAHGIYYATFGDVHPASIGDFVRDVFTTKAGWTMIVVGIGVGALFAALVLACSVVSFPLLLDRDVGLPVAIITSMRVTAANPVPIAAWGLIVAAGLVLGSIPFFLGLIVVMPILGHATWHLYRRTVVAEPR
ncbi:DUF2189 domain-containing protein [Amaricoccus sp.]|uniref:DUF2189 domain-containing protein n=1 Tax=Amaricoccus sp. TaxID=1872485 RepID=UPI0026161A3D|nr:DUF2189 domain-containing protein [Amaricoccus sp.]HRO10188.1 DUF2189 domain-containing protein [Amaricoccus sp.]